MYRKSFVSSAVIRPNAITALASPALLGDLIDTNSAILSFSYACRLADLSLGPGAGPLLPRLSYIRSVHFNADGGFLCS
jgi:hypothetical protein